MAAMRSSRVPRGDEDEDRDATVLEAFDVRRVPSKQSSHRGGVDDQERTPALGQVGVEQLVEQTDLVGTTGERGVFLAEVLGG